MHKVHLQLRPGRCCPGDVIRNAPVDGAPAMYRATVVELTPTLEIRHRFIDDEGRDSEVLFPPKAPKLEVERVPSYLLNP